MSRGIPVVLLDALSSLCCVCCRGNGRQILAIDVANVKIQSVATAPFVMHGYMRATFCTVAQLHREKPNCGNTSASKWQKASKLRVSACATNEMNHS